MEPYRWKGGLKPAVLCLLNFAPPFLCAPWPGLGHVNPGYCALNSQGLPISFFGQQLPTVSPVEERVEGRLVFAPLLLAERQNMHIALNLP